MELFIGLMSGTSMDGIDAALLQTDGQTKLISKGHVYLPYDANFIFLLKSTEWICKNQQGEMPQNQALNLEIFNYFCQELKLSKLEAEEKIEQIQKQLFPKKNPNTPIFFSDVIWHSTQLHALAIELLQKKYAIDKSTVRAVGYHGQTLFHKPSEKKSLIIGDGQILSNQIQIPVINQFRLQDILSGGQGAPLAPIYHRALALRDGKIPAVVINCGGIANATLISDGCESELMACDTGTGNVLIDRFVRTKTGGQLLIDEGGELGLQGQVNQNILKELWQHAIVRNEINYFDLPCPKSLDSRDCQLVDGLNSLSLEDGCRTLAAFTAKTMVKTVLEMAKEPPLFWILSGGGCHNLSIYQELEMDILKKIPNAKLCRAQTLNWENAGLEAELMAYLAARHLKQLPLSFPKTTGVPYPMQGGVYFSTHLDEGKDKSV